MAQAAVPYSTLALSAADVNTTINHEPRIMDLRLAEVLGFERVRKIRDLIQRHRAALERFAELRPMVGQTSRQGGRPGRAFWLTKKQALFICMKSETPRATEITIQVVEVFDEVTAGAPGAVSGQRRRAVYPRPVSKATLITYASWLWGERVRVLEQIYPNLAPGHRTGVAVNNPGYFYHQPRGDEVLPPPSIRAEMVLRAVGCPLPRATVPA